MSDWTTDIDHPKYKETKRKFQAEEPLTAIEALVAFNEFRGGLGDDGYSEMEIERHLQEHVTRVAELEAEQSGCEQAAQEGFKAIAENAGLCQEIADLQAQLDRANLDNGCAVTGLARRLRVERTQHSLADLVSMLPQRLDRATEPRAVDPDYHERCEDELQWWRQTHTDEEPPADIWDEETPSRATALRAQLESSRAEVERLRAEVEQVKGFVKGFVRCEPSELQLRMAVLGLNVGSKEGE